MADAFCDPLAGRAAGPVALHTACRLSWLRLELRLQQQS